MPVVFAFHGSADTGQNLQRYSGFDEAADRLGYIMVYPEATKYNWTERTITGNEGETIDDVQFFKDIISKLQKDLKIDRKRIYSFGFSAGGFLSHALACYAPEYLAAYSTIAASMDRSLTDDYSSSLEIPVLMIQGTEDESVLWEGSEEGNFPYLSQEEVLQVLLTSNNCQPDPVSVYLPVDADDGRKIRRETYKNDSGVTGVEFYIIENGHHDWPYQILNIPDTLLNFFKRFKKP